MEIRNFTPHMIVIASSMDNVIAKYPSVGNARVSTIANKVGSVEGIDIVDCNYTEVTDLPEPQEGVVLLVSMVVGNRPEVKSRVDVISPDTSPEASIRYPKGFMLGERDMTGMIFGVTRFVKY